MPVTNPPELLSVDVDAMEAAARDAIDGNVRSFVEFDANDFNVVYVDDVSLSFYEDEEQMMEHFSQIHSYVHLDFTEMTFYTEDIFPISNRVRYIATGLDVFTVLRIYFEDEGIFLALDEGEEVEPIVDAVEDVYRES